MNILFYAEIHPIRKSHYNHKWIIDKILNINKKENLEGFKIICNPNLREKFNSSNIFIDLIEEEKIKIESFYKKIDSNNYINDWKLLMNAENEEYNFLYNSILERVYKIFKFDCLIYWGTNQIIKNFCIYKNIPAISAELGPTRYPNFKPTVYLDIKGVNGNSSLDNYSFEEIKNSKTTLESNLFINELSDKLNYCSYISDITLNKLIHNNWGKNILVPLQLDDDSNIILYSQYVSLFEFVKEITDKFKNTEYVIYILPHPARKAREFNNKKHEDIKNYVESLSNCFWLEDIKSEDISDKCNYIITINSSLAFEQMLRGKIVINKGKSCWNIKDIFPSVDDILSGNINYKNYRKNIDKLCSFLLEYYLIPENKFFELDKLKNLLEKFYINFNILNDRNLFTQPINNYGDYLDINQNKIKLSSSYNTGNFKLIYSNENGNNILGNISKGRLIEQEFKVTENNLNAIELKLATYALEYQETLTLYLLEKGIKKEIIKRIFQKEEIVDNSWIRLNFDPIKDSQNKTYIVRILKEEKQSKSAITLYYSPHIKHLGNLFINGKKLEGLLNIRLFKS